MELPELACKSAETLWGQRVSRKHFRYDGYDHNNVRAYGLSDNADHFDNSDSGRIIEIPYLYRLDRKEIGTEIIAKINREGYLQ